MKNRMLWSVLWLTATPTCAQLPNLLAYQPGTVHLELSATQESHLGVDLDALENTLCARSESRGVHPPGETCRLVITNDGSHGGAPRGSLPSAVSASAGLLAVRPCGSIEVSVTPTGLGLVGAAPIVLGCGRWNLRAELSTSIAAPPSTLTLVPAAAGSSTGLFHGTLGLALDVTYSSVDGSEISYTEVRHLALDVSGRWTVLQSSAAASLAPDESNLALFVDREPAADAVWTAKTSCGQARQGCSHLCLVGAKPIVDALNGLAAQ